MSQEWIPIHNTWRTDKPSEPPPTRLVDTYGRVVKNIRISVTDRCNFRCVYCMPEEMAFLDRSEVLTFEEITRIVGIVARMGVDKVRLTGGEPTVRRELPKLVRAIADMDGIDDLALTTNGVRLPELAKPLRDAGLQRLNVSLDSLDPATFAKLTRRDMLDEVLAGIDAALDAGFTPLKVNAVAMPDVVNELIAFAELARAKPIIVRFIEFMPLDGDGIWQRDQLLTREEIVSRIDAVYPLEPVDQRGSSPAERFRFKDGKGEIGVIASVTEPFCESCDRIRLTADGKIRTCLFSVTETDIMSPMRDGADDDQIAWMIADAVHHKERGHLINHVDFLKPQRNMSQIGG
ncbi:MAG: GTP 3',8-cyclase MoaA [Candidatus Poribacteria bacterium]|nr:GTP 3',8-cyclase MoaA [Candidatus Poribacteria bacterium]